ncbi:MAG TPA: 30S ribosomal protein S13 [Candidatus Paceibacterota bacterium]|jgi:small subunit ribosomal protein S13|nr:30S ribosomal protein S13 [Candidatus Paceibacterota bacterium]HRS47685.1 30S ribosomal protein S13 [Candidatus Paceibacterota bacterium]
MRILGADIPDDKRVEIALTYVFGIGRTRAREILENTKIDFSKKSKELTPQELNKIKEFVEKNYKVEGDLRREIASDIKRLKDIKCYRGIRHIKRLPVRGQSTKRNSRTVRGNVRKSVGSGRKKAASKT